MEANLGFSGFSDFRVCFEKTVCQKESQDIVVPDTLPDIAEVLCTNGNVLIRSKDTGEGHVRMDANVPARVFCAGEDGQRYSLDVNIPYYISVEDSAIQEDSICTAVLTLRHLETRMLNPRKISVRAEICAQLTCYLENRLMFSTAPEETESSIHVLEQEAELSSVSCVTEKTFVLTDEFSLSQEQSAAAEIIAQNADAHVQEIRSVGSKLILKGVLHTKLLYSNEAGGLEEVEFETSFSQIIDVQTDTEDSLCEATILISGMYYELTPGSDGRSFSMELHLVAQVVVYTRRQIRYLKDAYSNAYALALQRQEMEIRLYGRDLLLHGSCSASVDTAGEVGSVIACHAVPIGWEYDHGEISVQMLVWLCWESGDSILSAERTVTSSVSPETGGQELKICAVSAEDIYAAPTHEGIELRISLEARAFTVQKSILDCISAITYDETQPIENDDRPTLMILYPRCEGDLWSLAKEHCSTVESICKANGISDGTMPTDRLLLIPKSL